MFEEIVCALPTKPTRPMWTDGDTILCSSEELANAMANMIENLYEMNGQGCLCVTGLFDDSEQDKYTGWWYVELE